MSSVGLSMPLRTDRSVSAIVRLPRHDDDDDDDVAAAADDDDAELTRERNPVMAFRSLSRCC